MTLSTQQLSEASRLLSNLASSRRELEFEGPCARGEQAAVEEAGQKLARMSSHPLSPNYGEAVWYRQKVLQEKLQQGLLTFPRGFPAHRVKVAYDAFEQLVIQLETNRLPQTRRGTLTELGLRKELSVSSDELVEAAADPARWSALVDEMVETANSLLASWAEIHAQMLAEDEAAWRESGLALSAA